MEGPVVLVSFCCFFAHICSRPCLLLITDRVPRQTVRGIPIYWVSLFFTGLTSSLSWCRNLHLCFCISTSFFSHWIPFVSRSYLLKASTTCSPSSISLSFASYYYNIEGTDCSFFDTINPVKEQLPKMGDPFGRRRFCRFSQMDMIKDAH